MIVLTITLKIPLILLIKMSAFTFTNRSSVFFEIRRTKINEFQMSTNYIVPTNYITGCVAVCAQSRSHQKFCCLEKRRRGQRLESLYRI